MDLATSINQTFVWSLNVAAWASIYDLTTARFEMQVRKTPADPTVVLAFDSAPNALTKGTIAFQPGSKLLIIRAPAAAVAAIAAGTYSYDLRLTVPIPSAADPLKKLFTSGSIVFGSGVTR